MNKTIKYNQNYNSNCITINTDASFCQQTKASGYAFWIVTDDFTLKDSGYFKTKTENPTHAEIKCIGNAIFSLLKRKDLKKYKWLIINTDSKQAMQKINNPKKDNSAKTTLDLYIKLQNKIESTINQFRHVKAHSKLLDKRTYVNDWCDTEAKKFMKKQREIFLNNEQITNYSNTL